MIHLVSLNPSLDIHFELESGKHGKVGVIRSEEVLPGGKALNVARFLRKMRVPCLTWIACTGGDAPTHRFYRDLLKRTDPGLAAVFVPSRAPVRFNLHVRRRKTFEKHNHSGYPPSAAELRRLLRSLLVRTRPGDVVVLTGRLPGGAPVDLYHDWILALQALGRAVVVDTSGPCLRLCLSARPCFVKVNLFEMEEALGESMADLESFRRFLPLLVRRGVVRGAVTDGARGSVVWEGTAVVQVRPARPVRNGGIVGAGDGFLAGWLAGIQNDLPLATRARFATGCAEQVARLGIFGFKGPRGSGPGGRP